MTGQATTSSGRPQPRSALRAVAVPSEHGGWGLTAEPVLLGLLVAPSIPGALLGAGALVAFVARTPVKVVLVDRSRHRRLPRTVLAERVAAGELAVLGVLVAMVAFRRDGAWWAPLAAAMPPVAVEMWFDIRSRGRRLVPELCGAVGIASVSSAIALAGGAKWPLSLGLWVVLAARSIAAIPYVRTQVMRAKDRAVGTGDLGLAQGAAVALAACGWWAGILPLASVVALCALALWALWSVRRRPPPVAVLGASQLVFGVALVLVTAGAVRLA